MYKVFNGVVKVEAMVGNTLMGLVGLFLVVAAIILAVEGAKALTRYRNLRTQPAGFTA